MKSNKYLGCIPDLLDGRDIPFKVSRRGLPSSVDLRSKFPKIRNQGALGSCTGFGVGAALDFLKGMEGGFMDPSPLFLYYHGREAINTINSDSGAMIRDVIKGAVNKGVCREKTWPYKNVGATFRLKPSSKAYGEAEKFQLMEYQRINELSVPQLKQCLAEGYPFVFGMTLYESFDFDKKGVIKFPDIRNEQLTGGHCMTGVGYKEGYIIARNSWGTGPGDRGYYYIPEKCFSCGYLVSDVWTLRDIE